MKYGYIFFIIFITTLFLGCTGETKVGNPELREINFNWGQVTPTETEIITNILIYNPNPVSLPLKDVQSEIYMNNIKMGECSTLNAKIEENSESTIIFSTKLENSRIPEWWVSHIKNDEESTMNIDGYVEFNLEITDFKYPFKLSNPIKTDILSGLSSGNQQKINVGPVSLRIKSESYWGDVNKDYTEIITLVTIYNDNLIPVPVTKFESLVEMNDIKLAETSNNVETIIPPKSERTLTLVTKLDNKMLDEWWVSHITNEEHTEVEIILQAVIEVSGNKYKFKLGETESEFTTNLLGD
ncbi:MAG: hypothetical protein GPJ50_15165 [Candidatus Heimdallarchaeota archaeon]|nr:hypothetical protein [Candidatus Heimdallarchaeota archaeon]